MSPTKTAQWTEAIFTEMGFKEAIQKKRQTVSERDAELLVIKLENQKNVLQIRVKQLEEQLDKDKELLDLSTIQSRAVHRGTGRNTHKKKTRKP